jgi:hypothetical protein
MISKQKLPQNSSRVREISPDDVARQQRSDCSQRKTQAARILARLIEAHGGWVSVLEISTALGILQFSARIHELREIGFSIENRMELMPDGMKHSFYRLLSSSAEIEKLKAVPAPIAIAAPAPASALDDGDISDFNATSPPPAPASAPVLESSSDTSPPAEQSSSAGASEAAADPDWFTRTTGKRRAAIERESLWLWERER